jgi:LPS sulfotransferase NodH
MTTAPTRFIILGYARTGSNLLISGLEPNPELLIFSELFHPSELERERFFGAGLGRNVPYRNGDNAAAFLAQHVFLRDAGPRIRACGFKLFYDQARENPQAHTAWQALVDDKDLHVVHLTRWNLLDCCISVRVAGRTGQWFHAIDSKEPKRVAQRFCLPVDDCESYFREITTSRLWAEEVFAQHPTLDLDYERDLSADFSGTVRRVSEFLGVEYVPATVWLRKQQTIPPMEQLTNYDELKEHFRHTLFERYFTAD